MEQYLQQLNEQQRAAVLYCDGPQLVIAGAGSGKTRVLTYKIVHLIKLGYKPWNIMALTFTNKAAREMEARIRPLIGAQAASRLWMGTFHSIFARILRTHADRLGYKHDFTIYDATDSRSLIKLIVKDMGLDDKTYRPGTLQAVISNAKNALIAPNDYAANRELVEADRRADRPLTSQIYRTYWDRCHVAGAMDFDDLLYNTNVLLRDCPDVAARYQDFFHYILVDEYQDTNFAQHVIVKQLSKLHNRVCMVGDDAQSIYSFRGANIGNILGLKRSFPDLQTFKLERNYRSTQNIIGAANSLIEKNKGQIPKHIFSEKEAGRKVRVIQCYSDYEEAYVVANQIVQIKSRQGCSYEDFAVLYRTNAQSRVLEEALSKGGMRNDHGNVRAAIPYRIYGGLSFYERKEVKDAVCYLRMVVNPDDDEALRRIINYPARGIGATTVGKVQRCAIDHKVSMWQVINHPEANQLDVNRGTLAKLNAFKQLIQGLVGLNSQGMDAYEVTRQMMSRAKLIEQFKGDSAPENISRVENLEELLNSVHDWLEMKRETEGDEALRLVDYLAETSLATDQDTEKDSGECVTLMTVHAAKGLEFNNVIIVGVEENLFPSGKSMDSAAAIEEERRLLYVAITRAKLECVLTFATSRYRNGKTELSNPSRFLADIDPQFLSNSQTSASVGSSSAAMPRWQRERASQSPMGRSNSTFKAASTPTAPRRLTPVSQVAARPVATSGAAGGFVKHNVSELAIGKRIVHDRFGQGVVQEVDSELGKIVVEFTSGETKTLLLAFARFKIMD